jgi:hypothetical protein
MSGSDIRSGYIRILCIKDVNQRLEQLKSLQEQARSCGETDWGTVIRAKIADLEGNYALAIALCKDLIENTKIVADLKFWAYLVCGVAFGKKGDIEVAIANFKAVIDDPAAPVEQKAGARFNRGITFGQKGDTEAAISDFTVVIDDSAAPAELKAKARFNRGITFSQKGDTKVAILDFTIVIDDPATPAEQKEKARLQRMWLSKDPSGKLSQTANNIAVELDEETKNEFRDKLHNEREKKKAFFGESQFKEDFSFLLVAREWNSFTPAVPELEEPSRGGGYYLRHHGVGIVVDPGFDFLQIFADAGGRLCDIDHVVITHAHNDHTAEFEAILTLLYAYNNPGPGEPERPEKHTINVYLNQGAARKFAGMLPLRGKYIRGNVTLSCGSKEHPFIISLSEDILLTVLPAYHDDVLTHNSSVGLGFELRWKNDLIRRIVFTGDTSLFFKPDPEENIPVNSDDNPVHDSYPKPYCDKRECDLVIAHIGTITENDLQGQLGVVEATSQKFLPSIAQQESDPTRKPLKQQQDFKTVPREEGSNHLRLAGVFSVIHELLPKAAIVSEFGEEMKTIWIKAVRAIETQLNKVVNLRIPVFAGDPMMIYDIKDGRFLCHEDQQFHDPQELRMIGIYERRESPNQGHPRPYLFLQSQNKDIDPSDYEDKIREFHKNLKDRKLPHFKPKPAG